MLLDRGHRVVVTGRNESKLKHFLDEAGHPEPVAEAICFALDQPAGVDLNTLTIRPIGQPV